MKTTRVLRTASATLFGAVLAAMGCTCSPESRPMPAEQAGSRDGSPASSNEQRAASATIERDRSELSASVKLLCEHVRADPRVGIHVGRPSDGERGRKLDAAARDAAVAALGAENVRAMLRVPVETLVGTVTLMRSAGDTSLIILVYDKVDEDQCLDLRIVPAGAGLQLYTNRAQPPELTKQDIVEDAVLDDGRHQFTWIAVDHPKAGPWDVSAACVIGNVDFLATANSRKAIRPIDVDAYVAAVRDARGRLAGAIGEELKPLMVALAEGK